MPLAAQARDAHATLQPPAPLLSWMFDELRAQHRGDAAAAVQHAYSLMAAAKRHASASAPVRLFWDVVCGILPEVARQDGAGMAAGLAEALRAAAWGEQPSAAHRDEVSTSGARLGKQYTV